MRSYLLLFLSAMLLLFTLPKSSLLDGIRAAEQGQQVKKRCAAGALQRPCARKCLKHLTHSEQRGAGNIITDCSQAYYAILPAQQHQLVLVADHGQHRAPQPGPKPHSPFLQTEPDPPRCA